FGLAGCGRGAAPAPEVREPDPTITPARDVVPSRPAARTGDVATVAPGPSPSPHPSPPPPPLLLTELAPTHGHLPPLLVMQIEPARTKHLRPLVYFYADWCPPCRAFQENMYESRMKEALKGTFLVKLNLDDWHDKLKDTGFTVKSIPQFYLIGPD